MKTLSEYKEYKENKEVNSFTNESLGAVSGFDLSLVVILSSLMGYLTSMGFSITGRMINQMMASKYHEKHRGEKNDLLMKLKELTRSIPDITDPIALKVLNDPGEWDSSMINELRRVLYDKMTKEQQKEFDDLEEKYYDKRKKLYTFK